MSKELITKAEVDEFLTKADAKTLGEVLLAQVEASLKDLSVATLKSNTSLEDAISLSNMIKGIQDRIEVCIKDKLKATMEENYNMTGESSVKYDKFTLIYKPATTSERIDTTKFRKDNPDLAEKYIKITNIAPSITIKENKEK